MSTLKNNKIAVNVVGIKDNFAGIGNFTLYAIDELAKLLPETVFDIFINEKMVKNFLFKSPNINIIPVRILKNMMLFRIMWDQFIFPIRAILKRATIGFSMINVACILLPIRQYTFIYDLAEINMPERFSIQKRLYLKLSHWLSIKLSKNIITISNSTKNELINNYSDQNNKYSVVPLGYKPLREIENYHDIKFINNIELQDYFVFVSTLEPGKNVIRLIEAFKIFVKETENKKINLLLAGGKGWYYKEVMKAINDCDMNDRIYYLGYVADNELAALYANCRGFVFPSLYEGFGLPVLEAMQFYVPILTANTSSLPEAGGEGVVYCNPKDISDIVNGMKALLTWNKDDNIQHYEKQLEYYTWENCGKELKKILNVD